MRAITLVAHEHIVRLTRAASSASPAPLLSPRERECLVLWTKGLEDADVAERLRISRKTVRRHIEQAQIRLGVATRREAIARAIMTGQISSLPWA